MKVALIAFSAQGEALGRRMEQALEAAGDTCTLDRGGKGGCSLAGWAASRFTQCDALVFIGAADIAVRAVAPHLKSKTTDPAVLCCDEGGRYCVPLVSGHIGGANALATRLAACCGSLAVITTATDGRGLFAVDTWAVGQGLHICNPAGIKGVSARLLEGQTVDLYSDWPVEGMPPPQVRIIQAEPCQIRITDRVFEGDGLVLAPPSLALGVGCRRGTTREAIERAFARVMGQCGLLHQAVGQVASIDLKAHEEGLLAFCEAHGYPFATYTAKQLARVAGQFTPSAFVQQVTGVDNVCERAALAGGGRLCVPKQAGDGVTIALARRGVSLHF